MKTIITILGARWFITLLGAVLLSLLLWFLGPLVAVADVRPLESDLARMVAVAVILVAWGAANMIAMARARKNDATLLDGVAGGTAAAGDAAAADLDALKERLQETVALLKKTGDTRWGGKRHLYQLPWYILIGPPGSGKSTAIENSDLVRQTGNQTTRRAVRGVGGTRHCEWLFTENAVLIDTAGRYTTQDSDASTDGAAWNGFLGLLKKTRPRQPINGALIAISLADLATAPDEERAQHAQTIRRRLNELYSAFGVRFPVYLLLTKADLIAGFTEFFDDLPKGGREQVWGITFPLAEEAPETAFAGEFDLLSEHLANRMPERLQAESDLGRRGAIFGFPVQFASLKEPIQDFLVQTFEDSRYGQKPMLRGVYFTSGTQEGTPVDRLTSSIARMIGAEQRVLPNPGGTGRSYFLTRLLRDVVFPEASLVSTDPATERRLAWMQRGVAAAALLAVAGSGAAWTVSYLENQRLLKEAADTTEEAARQLQAVPPDAADNPRMDAILPPLNTLRALAAHAGGPVPLKAGLGLFQGDAVYEQAGVAYNGALNTLLLPAMVYRLEKQIRQNMANPDAVYDTLKVYLMLGDQGPVDRALIRARMQADWEQVYAAPADAQTREQLLAHLDSLLEDKITPVGLDPALIEQARRVLSSYPLAERVYNQVRQHPGARTVPEWRLVDAAGPAAGRVFRRPSGKLLSDGIPGLYTRDGFYTVFLPALSGVAQAAARDGWVIGNQAGAKSLDADQTAALERGVLQLYLNDYIARWDGALSDLALVPMGSLDTALQVAADLSGPMSPLRNLLTAVAKETKLAAGKSEELGQAQTAAAIATAARLPGASSLTGAVATASATAAALPQPGKPVDDHFAQLHAYTENRTNVPGGNLDDLIRMINDLYVQLNRLKGGGKLNDVVAAAGPSPSEQLAAAAARAPGPLAPVVQQMSRAGSSAAVSNARADLGAQWNATVLKHCKGATEKRYPFDRHSQSDTPLRDFGELFKPGGEIDTFFNTSLRRFVDMSQRPWRWQKIDGVDLGLSPAVLTQFERAMVIRDSLFANAVVPSVRFDLLPDALPATVSQAQVEIDGQTVTLAPGTPRPVTLQWPGLNAVGMARVTITPADAKETPEVVSFDGPWALFRLVDRSRPTALPSRESLRITVGGSGRAVTMVLRANTLQSPFTLKELAEFRCPENF